LQKIISIKEKNSGTPCFGGPRRVQIMLDVVVWYGKRKTG
jgi:hypothetical protein